MQQAVATPRALVESLWRHRALTAALVRREIVGRYRGSMFGTLWSFFNPVLMLGVYTFFFSVVFKARWVGGSDSKVEFALVLFAGLMVFNVFAECLNRAPGLVTSNVNYVKKIVFPLEILPVVTLGAALFHYVVNLGVWVVFGTLFLGPPPATILLLPLVMVPLFLIILGFSWALASLSVYLRDTTQVIGLVVMVLMFLSPVFYPIEALPESYRIIVRFSPVTYAVEQARDLMVWGHGVAWQRWLPYTLASVAIAWLGFAWFQKTRRGFADVL